MAISPVHQMPIIDQADDVFERLAKCERLLTARELGDILAISPKTLYNYVTRGMIPYFKIESNVRFGLGMWRSGFGNTPGMAWWS